MEHFYYYFKFDVSLLLNYELKNCERSFLIYHLHYHYFDV
jgi:hypothetical protein